jgi:hypothetical protein
MRGIAPTTSYRHCHHHFGLSDAGNVSMRPVVNYSSASGRFALAGLDMAGMPT